MAVDKRKNSDWLATLQCLAQIAILFAPIAIGLGMVAVYSAENGHRAAPVDRFMTGAIK